MPRKTTNERSELKTVNVSAAAIDIGSKMHMAAVNPACTDMPVRMFGTFAQDLRNTAKTAEFLLHSAANFASYPFAPIRRWRGADSWTF